MTLARCALAGALLMMPQVTAAEAVSLLGGAFLGASRGSLIEARAEVPEQDVRRGASLFAGRAGASFFAPMPQREDDDVGRPRPELLAAIAPRGGPAERIRHLIAAAEAGSMGYDAVQHAATRKPARPPTEMTVAEIYEWIRATPGQQHAIGRYQFIPSTLRRLVKIVGADPGTRFSPELQDRLADVLLEEAGFSAAQSGEIGRHRFMNNLAKIWAGLPNSSGRSHYHGFAGNRATMTWARFDAEMGMIFPG